MRGNLLAGVHAIACSGVTWWSMWNPVSPDLTLSLPLDSPGSIPSAQFVQLLLRIIMLVKINVLCL